MSTVLVCIFGLLKWFIRHTLEYIKLIQSPKCIADYLNAEVACAYALRSMDLQGQLTCNKKSPDGAAQMERVEWCRCRSHKKVQVQPSRGRNQRQGRGPPGFCRWRIPSPKLSTWGPRMLSLKRAHGTHRCLHFRNSNCQLSTFDNNELCFRVSYFNSMLPTTLYIAQYSYKHFGRPRDSMSSNNDKAIYPVRQQQLSCPIYSISRSSTSTRVLLQLTTTYIYAYPKMPHNRA